MCFNRTSIEYRLHITNATISIVLRNGYFFVIFVFVLPVNFGNDAGISESQYDHEDQAEKMKNDGYNEKC